MIHKCCHCSEMKTPVKNMSGYKPIRYFSNGKTAKTSNGIFKPMNQIGFKVTNNRRCYLTPKHLKRSAHMRKNTLLGKPFETILQKSDCNFDKRNSFIKLTEKRTSMGKRSKNLGISSDEKPAQSKIIEIKKKSAAVQDEVSHIEKRVRYLLLKMKLEQSLIDVYSGDGWKGHSREKIKPEKELQRAERQILRCKVGIRDSIHQLNLLGSEGRIEDTVMHPDGSVFHEFIFCAKCKLHEAFPDNDIILCDGSCNCGFHQNCLDPPLEKIPPGDQAWLCKVCDSKMEILETLNAHLGTCFTMDSSWEDVFKEASGNPNSEGGCPNHVEDWPSDDSEDEDYCPNRNKANENISSDECNSTGSIISLDASLNIVNCPDSDGSSDEITNYRRKRKSVDYKKLYNEMFGTEPNECEALSADEDWGPYIKKKVRQASDACIISTDDEDRGGQKKLVSGENVGCNRKSIYRIPPDAIEKLRQFFAENELPSKTDKENLSNQLGISVTKVDKWFKNRRYSAIRIKKEEAMRHPYHHSSDVPIVNEVNGSVSLDGSYFLPLASIFHLAQCKKRINRRESLAFAPIPVNKKKVAATTLHPKEAQVRPRLRKDVRLKKHMISGDRDLPFTKIATILPEAELLYTNELNMLWKLERRLHQLKQRLLSCKTDCQGHMNSLSEGKAVIYVPFVEVKEKVY